MPPARSEKNSGLNILAVEPFYGGSHRDFIDGVIDRSTHRWSLVTAPSRHWKWRMRCSPLLLAEQIRDRFTRLDSNSSESFDAIFCTSMLDVPQLRGSIAGLYNHRKTNQLKERQRLAQLLQLPLVCYFHENQFTYPIAGNARQDDHFGYTNLLSALGADEVWFNSKFHRRDFLNASARFLEKMPDSKGEHHLERLAPRSVVIYPGFDPVETPDLPSAECIAPDRKGKSIPLTIGWVSRWEYDKRPDQFLTLLRKLNLKGQNFRLVLLGPRPKQLSTELVAIENEFSAKLIHSGFAETRSDYCELLAQLDLVVSTADHEFFGIAICEAISAGAVPVLPDRLSYRELVPKAYLYQDLDHAVSQVIGHACDENLGQKRSLCIAHINQFSREKSVKEIDLRLSNLVAGKESGVGLPD